MQEGIQYCQVCEGVLPIWERTCKKDSGNGDETYGWVATYIEGALWCDCSEPSLTIESKPI